MKSPTTTRKVRKERGNVRRAAFARGDTVLFSPEKGTTRQGIFQEYGPLFRPDSKPKDASVLLDGDPFSVEVKLSQLSPCTPSGKPVMSIPMVRKRRTSTQKGNTDPMAVTSEKVGAKELRKQAQAAGIAGWDKMGREELAKALAKASKNGKSSKTSEPEATETVERPRTRSAKTKSKTTATRGTTKPATKTKASKSKPAAKSAKSEAPASSGITLPKGSVRAPAEVPFRKGSHLFVAASLLLKGGKRSVLAEKLANKVTLHPYQKDEAAVDMLDYDKRLLLTAQTMRDKHGYGIVRTGRGMEGTIKVFIPGGDGDPRNSTAKASRKAS